MLVLLIFICLRFSTTTLTNAQFWCIIGSFIWANRPLFFSSMHRWLFSCINLLCYSFSPGVFIIRFLLFEIVLKWRQWGWTSSLWTWRISPKHVAAFCEPSVWGLWGHLIPYLLIVALELEHQWRLVIVTTRAAALPGSTPILLWSRSLTLQRSMDQVVTPDCWLVRCFGHRPWILWRWMCICNGHILPIRLIACSRRIYHDLLSAVRCLLFAIARWVHSEKSGLLGSIEVMIGLKQQPFLPESLDYSAKDVADYWFGLVDASVELLLRMGS